MYHRPSPPRRQVVVQVRGLTIDEMVSFICDACGKRLKKDTVDNHNRNNRPNCGVRLSLFPPPRPRVVQKA